MLWIQIDDVQINLFVLFLHQLDKLLSEKLSADASQLTTPLLRQMQAFVPPKKAVGCCGKLRVVACVVEVCSDVVVLFVIVVVIVVVVVVVLSVDLEAISSFFDIVVDWQSS